MIPFKACHHCTKRVIGCHSTCKEYKEEKERNDKLKAAANSDKDARLYEYNLMINRHNKKAMSQKRRVTVRRNYR